MHTGKHDNRSGVKNRPWGSSCSRRYQHNAACIKKKAITASSGSTFSYLWERLLPPGNTIAFIPGQSRDGHAVLILALHLAPEGQEHLKLDAATITLKVRLTRPPQLM